MTEKYLVTKCFDTLRARLPAPLDIHKVNERSTSGEPDVRLTWNARTSFLEFKHLEPREPVTHALEPLQLARLIKLQKCSGRRAWVVAYRKGKNREQTRTEIYLPSALHESPMLPSLSPFIGPTLSGRDIEKFDSWGGLWREGYDHDFVAQLVYLRHIV